MFVTCWVKYRDDLTRCSQCGSFDLMEYYMMDDTVKYACGQCGTPVIRDEDYCDFDDAMVELCRSL